MAKKESQKKMLEMAPEKEASASVFQPVERPLQEHERRELFRVFWAENRNKYGKGRSLEEILWVHLKAAKLDDPNRFEEGLTHFGLKKVR